MPIYTYACAACGHRFDELQKLGAEPLTDCPECGEAALQKQLTSPNFHLKGKGWRNSDDGAPKRPDVRPKMAHTFDSPVPHGEHGDAGGHGHSHGHSHDHSHGHSHGHGHGHSHGHKHD